MSGREKIRVCNWGIYRKLGPGYDPIVVEGDLIGHPTVDRGSPGIFRNFDVVKGIGASMSGRSYEFDPRSFNATGWAKNLEEAFEWLAKSWVKDSIE